jgi:hypothetical protein
MADNATNNNTKVTDANGQVIDTNVQLTDNNGQVIDANTNVKTSDSSTQTSDTNTQVVGANEPMLTTIDNPYNPKEDYDNWKQWDEDNGYDTESYVARLLLMEDDTFEVDDDVTINLLLEKIYNDILEHDVLNVYMLV